MFYVGTEFPGVQEKTISTTIVLLDAIKCLLVKRILYSMFQYICKEVSQPQRCEHFGVANSYVLRGLSCGL